MGYQGTCYGSLPQEKALRTVVSLATDLCGLETPWHKENWGPSQYLEWRTGAIWLMFQAYKHHMTTPQWDRQPKNSHHVHRCSVQPSRPDRPPAWRWQPPCCLPWGLAKLVWPMAIPREDGEGVGPKGEGALRTPLGEPEVWIFPACAYTQTHTKGSSDSQVDKISWNTHTHTHTC